MNIILMGAFDLGALKWIHLTSLGVYAVEVEVKDQ